MKKKISRLNFLATSASLAAGATVAGSLSSVLTGCSSADKGTKANLSCYEGVPIPNIVNETVDGKPLKAGLIGCGGRGTGAAMDFMRAGSGLTVTHLADLHEDRLQGCKAELAKNNVIIDDANCFTGLDGYKKVIESDVDVVILAAPPYFRPEHFKAAVDAGKHMYYEKPCGVDSTQLRSMIMYSKEAEAKGLKVICGLVRRTQKDIVETFRQVANGAIGEPISAHMMRNSSALWYISRQKEWNDMQYMLRNWTNFTWLSSDMLAEQSIHEVDMLRWFMGNKNPLKATGYGAQVRRNTGDVYDFFSVNYEFENGKKANCSARQLNGCATTRGVYVYGTEGYTNCEGKIFNLDGTIKWEYPYPKEGEKNEWTVMDIYTQSHILLVNAIRKDEPLNDVSMLVTSNMMANMGRDAAYTGNVITWDDIMYSKEKLGPEVIEFRDYKEFTEKPLLPGEPMV